MNGLLKTITFSIAENYCFRRDFDEKAATDFNFPNSNLNFEKIAIMRDTLMSSIATYQQGVFVIVQFHYHGSRT